MELTKESALLLSIKKWELIVKHDGMDIPRLILNHQDELTYDEKMFLNSIFNYSGYCPLCEFYHSNCKKCPLKKVSKNKSFYDTHLGCVKEYRDWYHYAKYGYYDKMLVHAKKILELLKSIKL